MSIFIFCYLVAEASSSISKFHCPPVRSSVVPSIIFMEFGLKKTLIPRFLPKNAMWCRFFHQTDRSISGGNVIRCHFTLHE